MPRFEVRSVADLVVGDWAHIDGMWTQVLGCVTDPTGWTRVTLDRFPLPEIVVHQTVEVPWSPNRPAGSA